MINGNTRSIKNRSGYINAPGKEAAAKAVSDRFRDLRRYRDRQL